MDANEICSHQIPRPIISHLTLSLPRITSLSHQIYAVMPFCVSFFTLTPEKHASATIFLLCSKVFKYSWNWVNKVHLDGHNSPKQPRHCNLSSRSLALCSNRNLSIVFLSHTQKFNSIKSIYHQFFSHIIRVFTNTILPYITFTISREVATTYI